jgi:ArsR family metal-binding transcriptional regulator
VKPHISEERPMGINDQRDIEANLQIGPTDKGMVRLFIEGNGIEIPMDFTPDEAREIAEEIMAAAARARQSGKSGSSGPSGTPGGKKRR